MLNPRDAILKITSTAICRQPARGRHDRTRGAH